MRKGRGQLTKVIRDKAFDLLGYEISQTELRLMPYIQYVMVNEQKIQPNHINLEERKFLTKWQQLGFIRNDANGLIITKKFWDSINEILYLGYVDLK